MSNELSDPKTEIDNYRAFANAARARQNFEGTILKYTKGNWSAGKDGRHMNGTTLVARIDQLAVGWTKWADRRPVDYRVGFVSDGFRPPRRQDLDELDEATWPTDGGGRPRDPWQFGMHLPMIDQETEEQFIFSTSSQGGRNALANLTDAYIEHREQGNKGCPFVELNSDDYDHRSYGTVNIPLLDIVGWDDEAAPRDRVALPSTPMEGASTNTARRAVTAPRSGGDPDDEIPF